MIIYKKPILLEQYNFMLDRDDIKSADSINFTVREYPFDFNRSGLAGNIESVFRRNSITLNDEDMEEFSQFINNYINGNSFEDCSPYMIVSDQSIIVLAVRKDKDLVDSFIIDFALGNYFPDKNIIV